MHAKNWIIRSSMLLVLLAPLLVTAQTSKSIFFPAGKNSTTVTGTVRGHSYIDYKLNVLAGQTLKASLNSKRTSVFFNILPPGSTDVAIYNSSGDGNNYSGVADKSGLYAIRVYLMGAAKSENQSVNFGLTVSLIKPATSGNTTTTSFDANGQVRSSKGSAAPGSVMSDFGVKRTGFNKADLYLTYPGSTQRILRFNNGKWTCLSKNCTVTYSKKGDDWHLAINGTYFFIVPEAVVLGG